MTSHRLPPQPDEWIDRQGEIRFRFEGEIYSGFAGDTFSSALAANGVRMMGRSFKYHRPRGVYSLANRDVNAMFEAVDGTATNVRGDVAPIFEGADFRSVNTFGGLKRDRARFVDWFGRCLPVGFYYKTFYKPRRWFPYFERRMREMAGLGAINPKLARRRTPKAYGFCDVLVIGAGPAGLSAAIAAADAGAKVVVVDENQQAGGCLNYQRTIDGRKFKAGEELLAGVADRPSIALRVSTFAAGLYADRWAALVDDRRLTKMRAASIVIATGLCQQPAVFGNNDLPGVMLATAAQRLVHQFAVRPFDCGVFLTFDDDGYEQALAMASAGVGVAAMIDLRGSQTAAGRVQAAQDAGIAVHTGHGVVRTVPGPDKTSLREVLVAPIDQHGRLDTTEQFAIRADGLMMNVGWAPADGLFYQAGGRMAWSDALGQFVPESAPPGIFTAGGVHGVFGLDEQMADGRRAGLAAAAHLGLAASPAIAEPPRTERPRSHPYPIFPDPAAKCFVDLDEDVQYKDFVHAAQEGFDHVELMKRYSTYGMGPSQGKIANTNAIRILAKIKGQSISETGVTTSRPFYHPVPLSHLAGRGFHPQRRTPLYTRHKAAGAVFMPAGDWERPAYYAQGQLSREQVIEAEVLAVRQRVGLIDVGTLGKIEVNGPGAGEFIERLYTGRFGRMKVGTTRYGLMCDESGVVIDDGIVCRLAEDRFYLTTTTTASSAVYREMQRWALIWRSDVALNNATGSYGAINLTGPLARRVLKAICSADLGEAFPYLGVRQAAVADVPARLIRVGFVGEWGCEIHVPAHHAPRVWDALLQVGAPHGIKPFGVEAQRVLRLEKGHIIIGQDTDGLTTPLEAGMGWSIKTDKPFFIGQRSLGILARKPLKRQLAGFKLIGHASEQGANAVQDCHLIIERGQVIGRVTSIADSPTLKQTIGMAFLPPQRTTAGTRIHIRVDNGQLVPAEVCPVPFYDPDNRRQTVADG